MPIILKVFLKNLKFLNLHLTTFAYVGIILKLS